MGSLLYEHLDDSRLAIESVLVNASESNAEAAWSDAFKYFLFDPARQRPTQVRNVYQNLAHKLFHEFRSCIVPDAAPFKRSNTYYYSHNILYTPYMYM